MGPPTRRDRVVDSNAGKGTTTVRGAVWSLLSAVLLTATVALPMGPLAGIGRADDVAGGASEPLEGFEVARPRMGTIVTVSVYCRGEARANEAVRAAFDRLDELVAILSDYEPESELNRLVRDSRPGQPVVVSDPLFHVLEESARISKQSDGAFDVTVGPLTKLWRTTKREKRLPDDEVLAAARSAVGWEHVRLDAERRTVELRRPDMRLDLGGIAKGYIADEMLRVLREQGIDRAMIDAGGDLVVGDPPPGRRGWRIAMESLQPERPEGATEDVVPESTEPPRILEVANVGIATSGDLYRYVEIDGVRYSHIVDPRTGLGLVHRSSVTVIAPNGLLADAHASAISVLGPERGLGLARKLERIEASISVIRRGAVVATSTDGMPFAAED